MTGSTVFINSLFRKLCVLITHSGNSTTVLGCIICVVDVVAADAAAADAAADDANIL